MEKAKDAGRALHLFCVCVFHFRKRYALLQGPDGRAKQSVPSPAIMLFPPRVICCHVYTFFRFVLPFRFGPPPVLPHATPLTHGVSFLENASTAVWGGAGVYSRVCKTPVVTRQSSVLLYPVFWSAFIFCRSGRAFEVAASSLVCF